MIAATKCDACGLLVEDRWRRRHVDCQAPPLPQAFHDARAKVRAMAHNRKTNR